MKLFKNYPVSLATATPSKKGNILILVLMVVCFALQGCEALSGAMPGVDIGDKQNHSSTSTNNGNGAGRDLKAKLALNNGDDKSSSFYDSNVKQNNTSNANEVETGQGKNQLAGYLSDESSNVSNTKTSTKNDNSVVNNFDLSYLIVIVVGLVVSCLLMGVIFGRLIPTKQQKVTFDRVLDIALKK